MASAILLLGLPFYFGYGNPSLCHPDNSLLDNIWLTTFPLMFIGLAIGWKYEKLGGYVCGISNSDSLHNRVHHTKGRVTGTHVCSNDRRNTIYHL